MEIIGYIFAIIIGFTMGLVGGGGSILAVPVFAYLFLFDEKVATAYSLFVVGSAALVGGLGQHKNNNVDWRTAIVFGLPAIVGVWLVRHYVVPAMPDVLFEIGSFSFSRRMGMFGLFAVLMVIAAYSMLSSKEKKSGTGDIAYNYPLILAEGLIVGALTGFVGAGGGFLIIPALIAFANLEMKKAVGTSLVIIAIKSLLGFFLGDAQTMDVDWIFLGYFTTLTIVGIFIGIYCSRFFSNKKLKRGFGHFVLTMAIFIFLMEFVFSPL